MLKQENWAVSVFIYLCLFQLVPAHPCGDSPLRRFQPLARMMARLTPRKDVGSLMELLRGSNNPVFQRLRAEWRHYRSCVGLVDTGYFKRSEPPTFSSSSSSSFSSGFDEPNVDGKGEDSDIAVGLRRTQGNRDGGASRQSNREERALEDVLDRMQHLDEIMKLGEGSQVADRWTGGMDR